MEYYFYAKQNTALPPELYTWPVLEDDAPVFYNYKVVIMDTEGNIDKLIPLLVESDDISSMKPGVPYNITDFGVLPVRMYEYLVEQDIYEEKRVFLSYVFSNIQFNIYIRSHLSPSRGLLVGRFIEDGKINIFVCKVDNVARIVKMENSIIKDRDYKLSPRYVIKWIDGRVYTDIKSTAKKIFGPMHTDVFTGEVCQ